MKLNNPFKYLIFANLALAIVISIDIGFSSEVFEVNFDGLTHRKSTFAGYRTRGGYEIVNMMWDSWGNVHRLGNVPEELNELKLGETIKIHESLLFSKTVKVSTLIKNRWEPHQTSFYFNPYILVITVLSIIANAVSLRYSNGLTDYFLAIFSVFFYFTVIAYLFYI
jgi:maltoporin